MLTGNLIPAYWVPIDVERVRVICSDQDQSVLFVSQFPSLFHCSVHRSHFP